MSKDLSGVERLYDVMQRLRAPDGCPWDREQTLQTLRPCLLEETYELLHTIDQGTPEEHKEELGDVLLQVVFQSLIREEEGAFGFNDVAHAIADKLVRRHPHVFGDVKAATAEAVLKNWEGIKGEERKHKPTSSALDGVPQSLPALLKAQRTQEKASRVGFDWKDSCGALAKVEEELVEFKEAAAAQDTEAMHEEFGDLLFALVNTARFCHIDAESALRNAVDKFSTRFRGVEQKARERQRVLKECSLDELEGYWQEVKAEMAAHQKSGKI